MAAIRVIFIRSSLLADEPADFAVELEPLGPTMRVTASIDDKEFNSPLERSDWKKLVDLIKSPALSSWQSPFGPMSQIGLVSMHNLMLEIRDTPTLQAFLATISLADHLFRRAPVTLNDYMLYFEPQFTLQVSDMAGKVVRPRKGSLMYFVKQETVRNIAEKVPLELMQSGFLMQLIAYTNQKEVRLYFVPNRVPIKPINKFSIGAESLWKAIKDEKTAAGG